MARRREMDDLRRELKQHVDILDRLRASSESDALAVVRMLRTTSDVPAVHAALFGSVVLSRPSDMKTARAISPTTYSSVEFELAALHKAVYPTLTPVEINSVDLVDLVNFDLRTPSSPQLTSMSVDKGKDRDSAGAQTIDPKLINHSMLPSPHEQEDGAIGPSPTPMYCDERLAGLKIGFWTNVPINDAHAASAISFYLETDYGINGFFDADLFLDDLLAHRLGNCSAFLVNSLLSLACVSGTSFWTPSLHMAYYTNS